MSKNVIDQFQQQEAEAIALALQFNRWSRVMVALMIREQEAKLLASDMPVDDGENGVDANGLL